MIDHVQEMRVQVTVAAIDEKTENVLLVAGDSEIDFDAISKCISEQGATLHSIDVVEVDGC